MKVTKCKHLIQQNIKRRLRTEYLGLVYPLCRSVLKTIVLVHTEIIKTVNVYSLLCKPNNNANGLLHPKHAVKENKTE